MRIYCFVYRMGLSPLQLPQFAIEHYLSYHGRVVRNIYGTVHDPPQESLRLIRSGRSIPEVFRPPAGELIVSERVKTKLEAAAPLMFKEVIFEKLVDFYITLDDWTFGDTWAKSHRFGIMSEWFGRLRDVPKYHKSVGKYYQLIPALDHQVAAEIKCPLYPVQIDLTPDDPREQEDRHVLAHLNHTMFEAYPYIEGPKLVLLCTSPLFTVLEPEIDWTFFARGTIDVP